MAAVSAALSGIAVVTIAVTMPVVAAGRTT
jgi:hypothetical protein